MLVADLMNNAVVSIAPDEPAELAAKLLYRYNIGSVPVCTEAGELIGIVTDRDIVLRCVAAGSNPASTPVSEIMSRQVASVSPDDDIRDAAKQMANAQVRRLPVIKGNKVVGMLSLGDMARTQEFSMEASEALSEISMNIRKGK